VCCQTRWWPAPRAWQRSWRGSSGGAKWTIGHVADAISQTTSPALTAAWFTTVYLRVEAIAWLLTLPFLAAAAIQAVLAGEPGLILRALGYLPLAALMTVLAVPVTMLLLARIHRWAGSGRVSRRSEGFCRAGQARRGVNGRPRRLRRLRGRVCGVFVRSDGDALGLGGREGSAFPRGVRRSGGGERSDPAQRGDVVALPGPAGGEVQRPAAGVAGEPPGYLQQPAAQGAGGTNRGVR